MDVVAVGMARAGAGQQWAEKVADAVVALIYFHFCFNIMKFCFSDLFV